jgi:hypothetical protein
VYATVPVNTALDVSAARACITTRPGGLFFSDAPWRPLWIPDARHRYASPRDQGWRLGWCVEGPR